MRRNAPRFLVSALTLTLMPSAHAVLSFDQVSWTGPGTPNTVAPGTNSPTNIQSYIENVPSGELSIPDFPLAALSSNRVSSTLNAKYNFTFTGGNGDISLANTGNNDIGRGTNFFNSVNVSGLAGVTKLEITLTYNEFLGGRGNRFEETDGLPMLAALGVTNAGAGLNIGNFNTTIVLGDSFSSMDGINFTSGLPASANTVTSAGLTGFDANGADGPTFTSTGFTGTVAAGGGPLDNDFLLIRGIDGDGTAGFGAGDLDLFYAKSITWTIEPDSGSFEEETAFTISMDGAQHANLSLVPEPSSALFLSFAASGLLLRRKR